MCEEKLPDVPDSSPVCRVPSLSPDEVAKNVLRCFALAGRVTLKGLEWLHVMVENEHAGLLGTGTAARFVMANLGYKKSEAFAIVRVARNLKLIPKTIEAFGKSALSLCQLKEIARIARPDTEEKWIRFAARHTADRLALEVQDALNSNRKLPRDDRRGLPNVVVRQIYALSREKLAIVHKASEFVAEMIAEKKDCTRGDLTQEEVLVKICELILEWHPGGEGWSERKRSIFDVVYEKCRCCHESVILTKDGPVEVGPESMARIEPIANTMEILDSEMVKGEVLPPGEEAGEIPESIAVKVLASHDHSCTRCGRRLDLHIHHVIFKSNQGPNAVWNLIPTCKACHGALHEGALEAYREAGGTIHWKTRAEKLATLLADEIAELAEIPSPAACCCGRAAAAGESGAAAAAPASVLPVEEPVEEEVRPAPVPREEGGLPASPEPEKVEDEEAGRVARDAEAVTQVLVRKMGYERSDAREMVAKGLAKLRGIGRCPTGDEILNTSLTGRPVLFEASRQSGSADCRHKNGNRSSLENRDPEPPEKGEEKGEEGGPADGTAES